MGSLPAERTKMSGVVAVESLKEGSMEKGTCGGGGGRGKDREGERER